MTAKDKAGQVVYITCIEDAESGYYCETFADEALGNKIDDFVVYPTDLPSYYGQNFYKELDGYLLHYYDDKILDLNDNDK